MRLNYVFMENQFNEYELFILTPESVLNARKAIR